MDVIRARFGLWERVFAFLFDVATVMILISRCFDVLSEEIVEFLTRQCNVRIASLPLSQTCVCSAVLRAQTKLQVRLRRQAYDCLLVSCKETLTETISWEEFDLVIYYEKQDDNNAEIARNVRVVELKTSGINSQTLIHIHTHRKRNENP